MIPTVMKHALVTGANGFVGSRLCRELLEHRYHVRALHRPNSDISTLGDLDVEKVEGDVTDPASLRKAFSGIDVVFHIAALFRQAKHPPSVYHQVNVEGTRNVFNAAIQNGVSRIIHCSTVGVHSHIPNPPANESEEYRPGDIYQETKCEGEKVALSFFNEGKIEGAVIRPAMIWGPGDSRTLKLFKGIANRRFPLIGTGRTLLHWILVDDLVSAFRLAAEKEDPSGEVYIIAGERPVEMKYLIDSVAKAFKVKPPPFRIPAFPIQLIGTLVEAVCIPFGIEPPIYRRRVDFFTKTRAFDSTKAARELSFKPAHSFEEEVELICNWYREHGCV